MVSTSSLAAFSATNIPTGPRPTARPDVTDMPTGASGVQQARANQAPPMQALPSSPPAQPPPRGSLLNLSV